MGRTKIKAVKQPDDVTCGPAALKTALTLLDNRISLPRAIRICGTTRHGTSTRKMLKAIRATGKVAAYIRNSSLRHIRTVLSVKKRSKAAIILPYLYSVRDKAPQTDSGHWAVVASYSPAQNRIVLFDSYIGGKSSYRWQSFRNKRWVDYELRKPTRGSRAKEPSARIVKRFDRPLIVVANRNRDLPAFARNRIS